MNSKYKFVKHGKSAFVVKGEGKGSVIVSLNELGRSINIIDKDKDKNKDEFKLHAYRALIRGVVKRLWTKEAIENISPPPGRKKFPKVYAWATQKTAKAICRRFKKEWECLLSKVEPQVIELDKRLFHCSFKNKPSPFLKIPNLLENKYLISDILKYRAAACVFDCPDYFFDIFSGVRFEDLRDWKALLSPFGKPYTSLNRTLMNLPGGIPVYMLKHFRIGRLERPVFDRIEIIFILAAFQQVNYKRLPWNEPWNKNPVPNLHIFQHATRKQITTAMKRIGNHTRNRYSTRKTNHIADVVVFLMDYPTRHTGNVVGLAAKSIKWHQERQLNRLKRKMNGYKPEDKVKTPNASLPNDSRIKFLETVKDILDESEQMNHCIDCYIPQAMRGDSYLFHIEYKGEHASIEVSCGHVRQAHGPKNHDNAASNWGKIQLKRWAKNLDVPILKNS